MRYRIPHRRLTAIGRALQAEWSLTDVQVDEALREFFGGTK